MATFLCLNEHFYEGPWSWRNAVQIHLPSPVEFSVGFSRAAELAVARYFMGDEGDEDESVDTLLLVKQQASGEIRRYRVERQVRYLAFQDNTVQPPREDAHASV